MINNNTYQFEDDTGLVSPNYTLPQYQVAIDDSISVDIKPANSDSEVNDYIAKNNTGFLKRKIGVYKLIDVIELENKECANSYTFANTNDYTCRPEPGLSYTRIQSNSTMAMPNTADYVEEAWRAVPKYTGYCGSTSVAYGYNDLASGAMCEAVGCNDYPALSATADASSIEYDYKKFLEREHLFRKAEDDPTRW